MDCLALCRGLVFSVLQLMVGNDGFTLGGLSTALVHSRHITRRISCRIGRPLIYHGSDQSKHV